MGFKEFKLLKALILVGLTKPPFIEPDKPIGPVVIGTNEKDSFGILKIYADKVGGGRTETSFKPEMKMRNYASGKKSEMSFESNNTASGSNIQPRSNVLRTH